MSIEYVREKFTSAVYTLASSQGGINQRLIDAYTSDLHLAYSEKDVPESIARRMKSLKAALTSKPAHGTEGAVAETVGHMSEDEASKLAQEIVSLAFEIERESGKGIG